jgi:acyl dehydratase
MLHVHLEVLESRPLASRPGVGMIRSRWNVMNQADETVLTMEGFGFFRRRTPAAS